MRALRLLTATAVVALGVFGVTLTSASAAQNSEQVVFSGTGSSGVGPFGNWIWCEADSENPYQGACNGSIYFYAQHLTKHVAGEITEGADGLYTMSVSSSDQKIVCQLSNPNQAVSGPHNTVDLTCNAPATSGSSTNEVIRVTGP